MLQEFLAFLAAHRLDRNTHVIVTADHGEELLERTLFGHGSQLYGETTHVQSIEEERLRVFGDLD